MEQRSVLYFIPSYKEFLKVQPGTGDNLSAEDIAAGFTDYVIWNRFRAKCLDIDGELEMECVDSGMVMIKKKPSAKDGSLLNAILKQAYGNCKIQVMMLLYQ